MASDFDATPWQLQLVPVHLIPVRPLTPRQLDIARRVGDGMPYAAIALELHITAGHVRNRVATIAALFPQVKGVTPYRLVSRYVSERRSVQ